MKLDNKIFTLGVLLIIINSVAAYQYRNKISWNIRTTPKNNLNASNNTKFTQANSTNTTIPEKKTNMQELLNRGMSYLKEKADHFKNVDKLITPGKIFNNQIDWHKGYFGNYIVSEQGSRIALNRNISTFSTEEMKKHEQVSVKGRYKSVVGSDVYEHAVSHVIRKPVRSHLFSDTIGVLELTLNVNKNFPSLNRDFLKAAYNTFYELPNKITPNHTMDDIRNNKEAIDAAVKFFEFYGTHFISYSLWGYRFGFYQEYKNSTSYQRNSKGGYHDINMTEYKFKQVSNSTEKDISNSTEENTSNSTVENNSTNKTIQKPIQAGLNPKPDLNQFYVGECTVDNFFIMQDTCNKKDPKLVEFEITPISYLFKPFLQLKKDHNTGKVTLDKEKLEKISSNMEFIRTQIQEALNPNQFVITEFSFFTSDMKDSEKIKCLTVNDEGLKKVHKEFKQTRGNKFYQEMEFLHNQNLPVLSFKNFNIMKEGYQIITKKQEGFYMCAYKRHILFPEELLSGSWKTLKYLEEVKMFKDNDVKSFEDTGYECKEAWEFENKKRELVKYYMCTKWSDNFINERLITDIKFFDFNERMRKCNDGFLYTYLDGKKYDCDCQFNFKELSDNKGQGDTFLCVSRKAETIYNPIIPNVAERAEIKNKRTSKEEKKLGEK